VLFILADFLLLSCGALWLKIILNANFSKVFLIGFLPFIPGDILKASAAAFIYRKIRGRAEEIF